MWQEYVFPETIAAALSILDNGNKMARIIAGGTDLILDLENGRHQVKTMVDLSKIEELYEIKEEDGMIHIGANATCSQVAASQLVQEKAPALAQGAHKLGSRQIRNVATLAGNVIRAQPAADTAIPLISLNARAEILSADASTRTIDVLDAYGDGFAKSTIDSTAEILTKFILPCQREGEGSAYVRHDKRKTLSLPTLNIACRIFLKGDTIEDATIAMGPVGPGPQRARDAEESLAGSQAAPETIRNAAQLVINQCDPRSSLVRGSRKYRMAIVSLLAEKAMNQALACARA